MLQVVARVKGMRKGYFLCYLIFEQPLISKIFQMSMFTQKLAITDVERCITSMHFWFDPVGLDRSMLMWGDIRGNIFIMNIEASRISCPLCPYYVSRTDDEVSLTHIYQGIISGLTLTKLHRKWKYYYIMYKKT